MSLTSSNSDKSPSRLRLPFERDKQTNSLSECTCKAFAIVEFAPIKGIEAYDFVVAKLCYEILRKISNSC